MEKEYYTAEVIDPKDKILIDDIPFANNMYKYIGKILLFNICRDIRWNNDWYRIACLKKPNYIFHKSWLKDIKKV